MNDEVPTNEAELRLYILEMFAEMITHYGVPIAITEIEQHVQIIFRRKRGRLVITGLEPLTSEGELLMKVYGHEERVYDAAKEAGEEPNKRAWTYKLTPAN